MSIEQIIGLVLALIIMFIGLLGAVLPGIPATSLVFLAALGHKFYFRDTGASIWVLATLGGFVILSMVLDYAASVFGAKKLGATRRGMIGAIVGALVGVFFSLPGVILGPFIGAFLFELLGGRHAKEAAQAGLGALLGLLAGAIGKAVVCAVMIGLFAVNILIRTLSD